MDSLRQQRALKERWRKEGLEEGAAKEHSERPRERDRQRDRERERCRGGELAREIQNDKKEEEEK